MGDDAFAAGVDVVDIADVVGCGHARAKCALECAPLGFAKFVVGALFEPPSSVVVGGELDVQERKLFSPGEPPLFDQDGEGPAVHKGPVDVGFALVPKCAAYPVWCDWCDHPVVEDGRAVYVWTPDAMPSEDAAKAAICSQGFVWNPGLDFGAAPCTLDQSDREFAVLSKALSKVVANRREMLGTDCVAGCPSSSCEKGLG